MTSMEFVKWMKDHKKQPTSIKELRALYKRACKEEMEKK